MSVSPQQGPAYAYAAASQYDEVPDRPLPRDPGFIKVPNSDGSEIGPLYLSPDAERWIKENVNDPGYVVDWGTREIIDPEDGSVKGSVPTTVPRLT